MKRGDIFWADLEPPVGRRPVLILSRTAILSTRKRVVVAPLTTTTRGLRSEVQIGPREGLKRECVANCDNVLTVDKDKLGEQRAGYLAVSRLRDLDAALRYALEIRY